MRLLLLGANGQVGRALRPELAGLGEVVCATRSGTLADGSHCEVVDFDQFGSLDRLVKRCAPDLIVNAAAYTAVDRAEQERDIAFRINAEAPGVLAEACARRGALLVHYSTDYVFDGSGTRPRREDDVTGPLGVYGASKLAGEEAIQGAGPRHVIFRTAWVYGPHGHNFLRTMLRLGAEREELRVVCDQIGAPTPASLIARVTAQALRVPLDTTGIRHLTTTGQTSWHGFATAIFEGALARGLIPTSPRVIAVPTSEYPTAAQRPAYSALDVERIKSELGITLPTWEAALGITLDGLANMT